MTTIVMNTLTGAVTEYTWPFASVTNERAASDTGLFTLGGNTDNGAQITGEIRGGKPGGEQVMSVGNVFVAVQSEGQGTLIVQGRTGNWEYPVVPRDSGVSSVKPGRGISESYLGFGYRNVAGADFRIDRIDAEIIKSKNRRV